MKTRSLVCCCAFAIWQGLAAESQQPSQEPLFVLASIPEDPRSYVLVTDAARYSFTQPLGWTVEGNSSDRQISLVSPDRSGSISIQIKDDSGAPGFPSEGRKWLEEMKQQFSEAAVIDQPQLMALGIQAISADLEWLQGGQFPKSGRFSWVPLKTGCTTFSLTSTRESFSTHLAILMQVMLSMRTAGTGEQVEVRSRARE